MNEEPKTKTNENGRAPQRVVLHVGSGRMTGTRMVFDLVDVGQAPSGVRTVRLGASFDLWDKQDAQALAWVCGLALGTPVEIVGAVTMRGVLTRRERQDPRAGVTGAVLFVSEVNAETVKQRVSEAPAAEGEGGRMGGSGRWGGLRGDPASMPFTDGSVRPYSSAKFVEAVANAGSMFSPSGLQRLKTSHPRIPEPASELPLPILFVAADKVHCVLTAEGVLTCQCGGAGGHHEQGCRAPQWVLDAAQYAHGTMLAGGSFGDARMAAKEAYAAAGAVAFLEWTRKLWQATPEGQRWAREAPLVALVRAVPAGLDPVGWQAAVLAHVERHVAAKGEQLRADEFEADVKIIRSSIRDGGTAADAYLRATGTPPYVSPERRGACARMAGRGSLAVDDGRDE